MERTEGPVGGPSAPCRRSTDVKSTAAARPPRARSRDTARWPPLPTGPEGALKLAQQLMVGAAEFHTVGALNVLKSKARATPKQTVSQGRPYKAVVVVYLSGGDSPGIAASARHRGIFGMYPRSYYFKIVSPPYETTITLGGVLASTMAVCV